MDSYNETVKNCPQCPKQFLSQTAFELHLRYGHRMKSGEISKVSQVSSLKPEISPISNLNSEVPKSPLDSNTKPEILQVSTVSNLNQEMKISTVSNLNQEIKISTGLNLNQEIKVSTVLNLKQDLKIIQKVESKKFQCDKCAKEFETKRGYTYHLEFAHTGSKFNCDHCGRTYTELEALKRHKNVVHKKEKTNFDCTMCHKRFLSRFKLNKHVRIHINA